MRIESVSRVSRPFPFPAFPVSDFRHGNAPNALHGSDNARFRNILETQLGKGVETAEFLVSTFPYILRIYGGAFQAPTIYASSHVTPLIPGIIQRDSRQKIRHRITQHHADARALPHFIINQQHGGKL